MKNIELAEAEPRQMDFKTESLAAMQQALANGPYPGYPGLNDRLWSGNEGPAMHCPWELSDFATPTSVERIILRRQGVRFDTDRRPLHPWFDEMFSNQNIRVVTGKGAYWHWGPNYTADPIVIRNDLDEPHVLLVVRNDTGYLALPGGFIDKGEYPLVSAIREADEETHVDISNYTDQGVLVYKGPLADLRTTANAWPETSAYLFDLPTDDSVGMPIGPYVVTDKDSGEPTTVCWTPVSKCEQEMFGSHKLLIQMALGLSKAR